MKRNLYSACFTCTFPRIHKHYFAENDEIVKSKMLEVYGDRGHLQIMMDWAYYRGIYKEYPYIEKL